MDKSKITAESVDKPTDDTLTRYNDKLSSKMCCQFHNFFWNATASRNVKRKEKKEQQSAGLQVFIKGEAAFGACLP